MAMSRPTPDFAMRQIAIFATSLVVAGGYAARYVDRATERLPMPSRRSAAC